MLNLVMGPFIEFSVRCGVVTAIDRGSPSLPRFGLSLAAIVRFLIIFFFLSNLIRFCSPSTRLYC